ncbi:MAG: DUF1611 domain-containing protein [Gemmatimonadota bacterium]|jgi:uncharacterized NAD-dependent epimerase/dehydratase family protein|nr:DUF1611 domain-containing protein [Gemmatimonadota bacterium]
MDAYRYLILAEGSFGPLTSKTANSAVRYLGDRVVAVLDSTRAGSTVESVLGFGDGIPVVATLTEGLEYGPTALLIGVAPSGGMLPLNWRPMLIGALEAGLPIVSGLHFYLGDDPELQSFAESRGVPIHDLRRPPDDLSVSTGLARDVDAFVVHTMGTDCNIGKMTACLEIRRGLQEQHRSVGFAPTGQTGILIEGWGIAVDSVVADFIAGAAERLVLQAARGNDFVVVEGQGSLVHPAYSGVTLGLLHGCLPDAIILCHQPSRTCAYGGNGAYSWVTLPSLPEMIHACEAAVAPLRPAKVIGIALNTWDLSPEEAAREVEKAERETGLPATDPVRFGPEPLVAAVIAARDAQN